MTGAFYLPIRTVAFEVVEGCNFRCEFCIRSAGDRITCVPVEIVRERACIDDRCFGRLDWIAVTGGEPFLHPGLEGIVRGALEHAHRVTITTNASVLNVEILSKLAGLRHVHTPDPAGSIGVNAYAFATDRPLDLWDPLGLPP